MTETKNRENLFFGTKFTFNEKETVFFLSQSKNGCDKIVFKAFAQKELKEIIYDLFRAGKGFDFRIKETLPNGCCSISEIQVPFA